MASQIGGESDRGGSRRVQRSQGFAEEVVNILRADIMSLRIPPDTRISIDHLARELGVSQTPIREALSMLEAMGLVTKRHYVGYCSAPQLNRKQVDELYEMRLLLEPYAARRTAQRMTPELAQTLRTLSDAMEPRDELESYDRFAQLDAELHDAIAAGSGNDIIQESLARLHSHFHIFRARSHSEVTREAYGEHVTLVNALTSGNADGAEQAMREHIQKSYDRLLPFATA
ncbi:GntR family transcriptional regulator [Sphingobium nicotianae]|uniref:GntR family transcriptional regulator n=1 Tax=Sphingobium nicotianae TaxID=2782607 RepID=A0A9X1DE35_9SPHN|nr:GntR family transcriptional regulator [Sphingobium nicotianae]MBT2188225.1 GntR family transcriptional regulator [Sphingobium nicotianae]